MDGGAEPIQEVRRVAAQSILTPTGGFLQDGSGAGYTHTLNPATGCIFARGFCGSFCYARVFAERRFGRGAFGRTLVVKENAARLLERELARAAARPVDHPHHLSRLRIFAASTTDPCAGPARAVFRECLRVMARRPPGLLVVQTRSPAVLGLRREILALARAQRRGEAGEAPGEVALSFTLETDDSSFFAGRDGPGVAVRRRVFERLSAWPLRRHLAVAPCLPLLDARAFADWIAEFATDATVDTFVSGDGSGGRRTASGPLPEKLRQRGHAWRSEVHARQLFGLLRARMGEHVGWSAAGFLRLAGVDRGGGPPGPRSGDKPARHPPRGRSSSVP